MLRDRTDSGHDNSAAAGQKPGAGGPAGDATVNVGHLRTQFDGNWKFAADVVNLLRRNLPSTLDEIHSAIAAENTVQLRSTAHALKGIVGTFGTTTRAYRTALELEEFGKAGELSKARAIRPTLQHEMEDLLTSLQEIIEHARVDHSV